MRITWRSWSRPHTPLLFAVGAIAALTLAIGTLAGIGRPHLVTDRVLHDTYYVVAHTNYTLKLAALFGVFALWYFVFPRITGWSYSDFLGKLHFWLGWSTMWILSGAGILCPRSAAISLRPACWSSSPIWYWLLRAGGLSEGRRRRLCQRCAY
jgi:heme/copper-type cytochrome/quinol oxidase subunit 1